MIIGNVGNDPRLSATQNNVPVCTFSVATNRSWLSSGASERKEEAQWHNIVAFNKLAEICSQILTKGTSVYISGRLQNRKFRNQNDEEQRKTEIVASEMIAFDNRKDARINTLEKAEINIYDASEK